MTTTITTAAGTTITRRVVEFRDGYGIQTTCSHPARGEWGVIEDCSRFKTAERASSVAVARTRLSASR